ncbi:MAG: M23 family metallopeptidase [Kiritimatiellae bacterium]|nr:M23 family metallopeptidase [Kiritimatiellia bacterium]
MMTIEKGWRRTKVAARSQGCLPLEVARRCAGRWEVAWGQDGTGRRMGRWALLGVVGLIAAAVLALAFARRGRPRPESVPAPSPAAEEAAIPPLEFGPPSPQTRLLETNAPGVYMPTASGRWESAMYGSVRTVQAGRSVVPSFHEGVDIAPLARGRDGRALDDVVAAADGTVAYVNRRAGNSDYGLYIVLKHRDPIGPLFTLYAHLDEISENVIAGRSVARGDRLGRMGRTPATVIPVERSHLHFEVGVMLNPEFRSWFLHRRLTPDHGAFNGWNLAGIPPLAPYVAQAEGRAFRLFDWMEGESPAFEVVVRVRRRPLYFDQYPTLWRGEPHQDGPVVISASESGVPLAGRNATAPEVMRLGVQPCQVLSVDPERLGRNGRRLVVRDNGDWRLGSAGRQWLEILIWPSRL